jgi:hypothetical protein
MFGEVGVDLFPERLHHVAVTPPISSASLITQA